MPEHRVAQADRFLFRSFLLLLIWAPIPLGSNRLWAEAILEIWIFSIAIGWLYLYLKQRVDFSPLIIKSRFALFLLLLWLVWLLLQLIPLPLFMIDLLGGELHQAYKQVNVLGIADSFPRLSIDPGVSGDHLRLSVALVLVFVAVLQFARSRRRIRMIGYAIVISGVMQSVYAGFMTLSGSNFGLFFEEFLNEGVATGTYISRTHFAGYLEMTLAVGIGLLIANLKGGLGHYSWRQRLRDWINILFSAKAIFRLSLVIMVIALVLTRSRMGNTGFFASMLIAGSIGLVFSRYATRSTVILLSSLIVIDIVIVGAFFGVEKVAQRIQETTIEKERRDDVSIYSMQLVRDHVVIGTGLGSYYGAFMPYRQHDVLSYYDHAHNDFIEIAADTGVLGFILLGILVSWSLYLAIFAQKDRRDPLMRGLSFASIMGITALLIHSTVDFNLQIPANAATFMVILAFAWISSYYRSPRD